VARMHGARVYPPKASLRLSPISVRIIESGFSAFPPMDLFAVLRLIHNLACKVRLVQLVAPCSANSTLAHQVSLVHRAGASAAWHYKLHMNSLRVSLLLPCRYHAGSPVAADRSSAPQCPDAINHPLKYLGRSQADRMVEHHFSCCRRYRNAHQCRPACPYQQSDIRPGSDDL
jgi:hypothetical protein